MVSHRALRHDFSLEGEKETYLHWIAFQMLTRASLDPEPSKELILKAAESRWLGVSRASGRTLVTHMHAVDSCCLRHVLKLTRFY